MTNLLPSQAIAALSGKKVFVTGHTGFKGSWLTLWLSQIGSKVRGYSIGVPTDPALFELANIGGLVESSFGDVRDAETLFATLNDFEPDVIFHLAAQPIVRESISEPLATFTTNAIGTANVLEYVRHSSKPTVLVAVTSDKVYQNNNWTWGYRETDPLSTQDPYSASKAMAETVIASYLHTFSDSGLSAGVGVGRAGNVIGGGDFASGRLIPDVYRAIIEARPVLVRNPNSTRPWQHVLEPLSGYLTLAGNLLTDPSFLQGEAFNFGPRLGETFTVASVLDKLQKQLAFSWDLVSETGEEVFAEARLLQLDWSKAKSMLSWQPVLSFDETISWTAMWYQNLFDTDSSSKAIRDFTLRQLSEYRARFDA